MQTLATNQQIGWYTHLDRHTRYVESMGEQGAFAQQPLISSSELDFGDRKSVTQVQGPVHVGEWEASEPFGVLFFDLSGCEAFQLLL